MEDQLPDHDPSEEMIANASTSEEGLRLNKDVEENDDDDRSMEGPHEAFPDVALEKPNVITYGRKRGVILDEIEERDDEPSQDEVRTSRNDAEIETADSLGESTRHQDIREGSKTEVSVPKAPRNPYDKNMKYRLQLLREEQAAKRSKVKAGHFCLARQL